MHNPSYIALLTGDVKLFKNHKMIFSIVDEPPSWSDIDDSPESMSEPEEEDEDDDMWRQGQFFALGCWG